MKYIIIESNLYGKYPVLFPDFLNHSDVAKKFSGKPVSAGMCQLDDEIQTFGESITLQLKCDPEDCKLIERMLEC